MKKKVMLTLLPAIGLAVGAGTQTHVQDTAHLCEGYHSHMYSVADGCLRMSKEQQAARDATAKCQAEATQRQVQVTRKQNTSTVPVSNTTVQPEAVSTANVNSSQQPGSQTAQQIAGTASNPCPYYEDYGGIRQHDENYDGTHQLNEDCSSGTQGYHHSGGRGQGAHRGNGNGHHRR